MFPLSQLGFTLLCFWFYYNENIYHKCCLIKKKTNKWKTIRKYYYSFDKSFPNDFIFVPHSFPLFYTSALLLVFILNSCLEQNFQFIIYPTKLKSCFSGGIYSDSLQHVSFYLLHFVLLEVSFCFDESLQNK